MLTSSETDALIDRAAKTAAGVKTTASVLGLTLGDFRATGGLDYLFDAIYGLAYSTNGRDANGHYLRGAALNAVNCALAENTSARSCGLQVRAPSTAASASGASAKNGASGSATKADAAATDLLFGGGR